MEKYSAFILKSLFGQRRGLKGIGANSTLTAVHKTQKANTKSITINGGGYEYGLLAVAILLICLTEFMVFNLIFVTIVPLFLTVIFLLGFTCKIFKGQAFVADKAMVEKMNNKQWSIIYAALQQEVARSKNPFLRHACRPAGVSLWMDFPTRTEQQGSYLCF